jgi:hypothetical protein
MQVTKISGTLWIAVSIGGWLVFDRWVTMRPSINDRMLGCKQGLPHRGSLLLVLLTATTATGQQQPSDQASRV